ncbi:MAG TPA: nuclear transport factor 2 family protein [Gaiellaceae bacterium]|nr:nuclear transport factor 2 family protein [Gaiellaceae bacterium]
MSADELALRELNERIGAAESSGDRDWLSTILAPRLAFQRADESRTVDDQVAFLQKVKAGSARATRIVEPIEVYGDRAIVKCIVAVEGREFHNLRLFVRREGEWKLLGWANEPC